MARQSQGFLTKVLLQSVNFQGGLPVLFAICREKEVERERQETVELLATGWCDSQWERP